jgi:D-alanyl-D-alanine carboxypeptidase
MVPYAGTSDCLIGPDKGRACYGLGIQRLMLRDGPTLCGKTGSDLGYFSAYFRTLSGSLSLFYAISETKVNGDGTPVGLRLANTIGLPMP